MSDFLAAISNFGSTISDSLGLHLGDEPPPHDNTIHAAASPTQADSPAAAVGVGSTALAVHGSLAGGSGGLLDGALSSAARWGSTALATLTPAVASTVAGGFSVLWPSATASRELDEYHYDPEAEKFIANPLGPVVLEGGGPGPRAPRTWILPEHRPNPDDGVMTNPIMTSGAWHTGTSTSFLPTDFWSTPGFPSSIKLGPNVMLSEGNSGSSGKDGSPSVRVRGFEHLPTHPSWAFSKGSLAGTVTQVADALGRPKSLVLYSGSSSGDLEVPGLQTGRYGTTLLRVDGTNTSDAINGIIDRTPGIWSYEAIMGVGGGGVKDMAQTLHTTLGQREGKGFDPNAPFVSIATQLSTTASGTPFAVVNGDQVIQGRRPDLTVVPVDHLLRMDPARSEASLKSGAADYLAGLSYAAAQSHAHGLPLGLALDQYSATPQRVLDLFTDGARTGESFHHEKYVRSLSEGFAEYATHDIPQISDEHHFYYGIEPLRDSSQSAWPTHGQSVGFGTILQAEALGRLTGDFTFADGLREAYGQIGIPSSLTDITSLGVREDQLRNALVGLPESSKPDRIGLLRHYIDSVPYSERPDLVDDLINFRR